MAKGCRPTSRFALSPLNKGGSKMAEHRSERLSELIKSEFGSILQRDIKDPRIGFVSVTDGSFE
mgnify:CR=1 FL=1